AGGAMTTVLLSVYDKTGLQAFAQGLAGLGATLVSSGGTSRFLAEAGIKHTTVEGVTASPEMLDGRVKTLHPAIHGGILADRTKPAHLADLAARGIALIDLVVCNLYPFASDPSVEMIDVGGPTMVRAAAKNHASVGVVVDPGDYGEVLDELRRDGELSDATRVRLARAAFAHTAAYDAAIVAWFDGDGHGDEALLPPTLHLALERTDNALRYGENPHQEAARYRAVGRPSWWDGVVQRGGLTLSYLNLYDAEAAWRLVHDLGAGVACAIVKHANPCGAAVHPDQAMAYRRAFAGDPDSAFGGIVAFNRPVDAETAAAMAEHRGPDVVLAPGYGPGTVETLLARRKNTRVLEVADPPPAEDRHLRPFAGGFLVQRPHHFAATRADWRVASKAAPTEEQWADAELAWRIGGHVKSNSIVLVRDGQAVGIGAGQQKRVDAGQIATAKAAGRAKGGACASDAFYPFRDGVDAAVEAGVAVVIQPGGSLRDDEIVAAADEHGIAMVLTGERHFLH
ncbi:MAG: bifunctional phosphoribosylaminoimidazolecarboxamide formyltransferase/IMP cyclohydrolase, partial [Acidimicrobiales bacterium]